MNTPTREDLLGYVLGALDADEQQQVEKCLQAFPELHLEIEQLKARNDAIRSAIPAPPSIPPGLARRTCEQVARRSRAESAVQHPVRNNVQSASDASPALSQSSPAEKPKRVLQSATMVCIAALMGAVFSAQLQRSLTTGPEANMVATVLQPESTLRSRPYLIPSTDGIEVPATSAEIMPITYTADSKPSPTTYSLFEISRQYRELNEAVAHDLLADIKDYRSTQDLQHFSIDPLIDSTDADYPLIQFVSQ